MPKVVRRFRSKSNSSGHSKLIVLYKRSPTCVGWEFTELSIAQLGLLDNPWVLRRRETDDTYETEKIVEAEKDFSSFGTPMEAMEAAVAEWTRAIGDTPIILLCECCPPPHTFCVVNEKGTVIAHYPREKYALYVEPDGPGTYGDEE